MIICYLPPIKGTRKLHWFPSVSIILNCCWKQELVKGLSRNRLDTDSSNPQAWQSLPSNPCCHLGGKTLVNKKWIKFWQMITLPKTNIAPWKDEFPFEKAHFQGLCLVSRRGKLSDLCLFFLLPWHFFGPASDLQKISASLPAPTSNWLQHGEFLNFADLTRREYTPRPWRVYERISFLRGWGCLEWSLFS